MLKDKLILGVLSLAFAVSCGHKADSHAAHDEAGEAHAEEKHAHSGEIVMSPEKAKAAGVAVEQAVAGDFCGVVPVGGKIMEATGDEATIVANVPGIVSFVRPVTEGMAVAKGKPLFTISGKELQDGDPSERARITYETTKKEYERAAKLVKDKIVTEKDFNAAKAAYENARVAYEAISRNDKGETDVKSPISGYIKTCLVKEGDYVAVGQPLASVTQNRRLYLKADVPERYYGELSNLKSAKFKTAYSDKVYDISAMGGRLMAFGKTSAGVSAYIPVTFEFNNVGGIIPGSFAEVYLLTNKRTGVISLPVSAITEEQGLNFVYIRQDADCYTKREVKLGESDGERVEICSGLKAGENVVIRGAVHIKLASASNAIPAHTHNH